MADARFLCAAAAADRGERPTGTASRIDRWLLVEASGPWGPRGLPQARSIDDALLLGLQQRAKAQHARTLLIRRPASGSADPGPRRVFVADSRPGHERLLGRVVADDELAELDLPYVGDAPGWEPVAALVGACTHGTHDTCCAIRGRPVAAALAASHPEIAWEVSHIGGDRFAANALVLPWGHYLGQLTAETAPDVVARLIAGEHPGPSYRGRSCWATPVQAAVDAAASELGVTRLDALRPQRAERTDVGDWRVELAVDGHGAVTVVLAQEAGPAVSRLTCRAVEERPVPHWAVRSLALG